MWIEQRGSGPDVVLIHGWAMHAGVFAPLSDLLSARFRLHLVDLPGHGYSSDAVPGALDPITCARQIAAVTPAAIWLGWSLGGLVALQAALDQTDRVRGLIEIAASPRFVRGDDWAPAVSPGILEDFARGLGSDYRVTIERFLALETLGSPQAASELRTLRKQVFERGEPSHEILCEGLAVLAHSDLRSRLPELTVPSLWIGGRRDRLIPPAAMQWAAQQAPRGHWLQVDSGHAPFITQARVVATAIEQFADTLVAS